MSNRFEVVPSRRWKNSVTGATASIHGSVPYYNDADKANWSIEVVGFTILDKRFNRYGIGRSPFATAAEAQAWIDAEDARLDACAARLAIAA